MNDWHTPYAQYIGRAHQDRAEALSRAAHRLVTAAAGIGAALRRWSERRRATQELLSLDDRLLKDIGISRGEVWAAVHGDLSGRGNESLPVADIALTPYAIAGCNDNQRPRRAA